MRKHYDYSADVPKLKMPVMLVFGDSDMYRPEHVVKFYQLLGGGLKDAGWMRETMSQNRLAIIPNRTHYDIFFAPELVDHRAAVPERRDQGEELGRAGRGVALGRNSPVTCPSRSLPRKLRRDGRIGLSIAAAAVLLGAGPARADVRTWVDANAVTLLGEYRALLAIPNVASDTPNIRRNADHIAAMMARRGLAPRLLESADGKAPPAIYGEWRAPGAARTLVLYAHYDGQPVDPAEWTVTPPFEPLMLNGAAAAGGKAIDWPTGAAKVERDWRVYARSASDDKAGVFALLAAVDALKAERKTPAFNVKFFLDGEEEAGSPNLAGILARHKPLLASDGWVIVDGPAHASGQPQAVLRRSRHRRRRTSRPTARCGRCTAGTMATGRPTRR